MGRVSSAAKPFLLQVVGSSPLDCHFPSTGLLQTEGLLCQCPSQGENGPCLADPKGWNNTPLSILPLLSSQGCLDVAGFPDGTSHACLESCCWTEQMAESVYLPPFIHQVGHCPEPPSLSQSAAGCLWAQHWTKVAAAVSLMSSACPCSSHLLSA